MNIRLISLGGAWENGASPQIVNNLKFGYILLWSDPPSIFTASPKVFSSKSPDKYLKKYDRIFYDSTQYSSFCGDDYESCYIYV